MGVIPVEIRRKLSPMDGRTPDLPSRDEIIDLLNLGAKPALREAIAPLHAEDVAELVESLGPEVGSRLLAALESEAAGEALAEMPDQAREHVLEEMSYEAIADAVDTLPADDAADVIGDLHGDQRMQVLGDLDVQEPKMVAELLSYPEDSAGGIMTPEVLAVPYDSSAADVIERLRGAPTAHDDVFTVYVVDADGRLAGRLPLQNLVTAALATPVEAMMERPLVSCRVDEDQEQVAQIMAKYNLVTIPIVDDSERLVGRVTFDDVIDVIAEEATEDILRMAGSNEREVAERSSIRIARVRLPWVVVGLLGGLFSGVLMSRFESVLQQVLGLAFFVPAVAALGGNVGIQSSTIVIRGMTVGDYTFTGVWTPILREIRVGLAIGAVCGVVAAVFAQSWLGDPGIGLIVGLAMWGTALCAAIVGAGLPFLLSRFDVDPAVATGPFITTANDVLGVLLYFLLAAALFGLIGQP